MTRTDGDVEYDHSNGRVTLELVTPPESTTVTSALAAGAGGNLNVQGTGGGPGSCADWNYLDSYNSSNTLDDYCSQTHGTNGNVTYAGDITMSGSADFEGSIRGGGYVHLTGSSYVTEDVYYSSGSEPSNSRVGGSVEQIAGVESASPINTHVAGRVNDVEGDNDNGDPGVPIDGSDRLTGSDPTLESGTYYLERVDMGSSSVDSLEIDTTGGDVTIAVNDYIHVSDGGYDITVTGSNDVRFYVNTSEKEGGSTGLHVGQSSEIATPQQRHAAVRLWQGRFQRDDSGGRQLLTEPDSPASSTRRQAVTAQVQSLSGMAMCTAVSSPARRTSTRRRDSITTRRSRQNRRSRPTQTSSRSPTSTSPSIAST